MYARPQVTLCGLRGVQNPVRTVSRTVVRCFCPGPPIPWTCACVITSVGCSWVNFEYLLMLEAIFGLAAFAAGCVVYGTVSQLQTCNLCDLCLEMV